MNDMMIVNEGATNWSYDVYLSFRWLETRRTFTGNLYNALHRKRFNVFMDGGKLKSGNQIILSLRKALGESRIAIVVLSQNFAMSIWCLDELAQILEYRKTKSQLIMPIFYDVDPSDVRRQTGSYGEAMAAHEHRFGKDSLVLQKWRSALSQVAEMSGWCFKIGYGFEYEIIERIVEQVTQLVPRYDVFLSFCGKDTRYSFTGFLYNALSQEGFETFMNDEEMEEGDQISQALITAIEKSRLSIIVFSENYAYSSLCLDELITILDCMKIKSQLVWPIFYKVEPSDLRHQRKCYGTAMVEHENRLGKDSEKLQIWRLALFEAANLKGWHLKTGYEYEFIDKLVEMAIKI
ncbi:TMV resistance protein N-like [Lotus japonicus]|uniref:TMV resistance protein N-like n=1 Tax=Lotus japonicus TaxID=34305 RepID=UPI00258B233E|nr:TMV resistance protein N-like [Lotus japonicus]